MLLTFFSSTKVVYLLRYQYLDHEGRTTVANMMEKPGELRLERHRLCNASNGGQIVGFLTEADVVQLTSLSHYKYSSKNTSEYKQAFSFHHCMAGRRDISNCSKHTHTETGISVWK